MSSIILTEFKKTVKQQTGKELQQRKQEIRDLSSLINSFGGAKLFFENAIVEVRFDRKLEADISRGQIKTRRMICTRNFFFAQRFAKHFGQFDMPYRPVKRRLASWYRTRNIILVWDLIECKYRMVHLKKWKVMDYIPLTRENVGLINEFTKKLNPRNVTEGSKQAYSRK